MLENIIRKTRNSILPLLLIGTLSSPAIAETNKSNTQVSINAHYAIPTEDIGRVYPPGIQYGASFSQRNGPLTLEGEFSRFQSISESKNTGSAYIFGSSQEQTSKSVVINSIGLNALVNAGNIGIGGGVIAENVELDENFYSAQRGLFAQAYNIEKRIRTLPFVGGKGILDLGIYDWNNSSLSLRASYKQTKPIKKEDILSLRSLDLKQNGAYTLGLNLKLGLNQNSHKLKK
jgi:hypothetical protein